MPKPPRLGTAQTGSTHQERGSAMTETVLVLPLIFVVLALLYFFGQAMTRWQRSSVTDRYEAWRQAQYADGPGIGFDKNPSEFEDNSQLNELFFAENADRVQIGDRAGRVYVERLTEVVEDETFSLAQPLNSPRYEPETAAQLVRNHARHLPAWWRVDLETEHSSSVPLYERFAGAVRHQSTVIDGDWAYGSWIEQLHRGDRERLGDILVNDVYFIGDDDRYDGDIYPDLDNLRPLAVVGLYHTYYTDGLDDPLQYMDAIDDNRMARAVRFMYISHAAYRGPQLLPELPRLTVYLTFFDTDPGDPID